MGMLDNMVKWLKNLGCDDITALYICAKCFPVFCQIEDLLLSVNESITDYDICALALGIKVYMTIRNIGNVDEISAVELAYLITLFGYKNEK